MNRQVANLAIIFSVVLNIAFVAGYSIQRFSNRPVPIYGDLDLTETQRARLENAHRQFVEKIQSAGRNMVELHSQLIDVVAREGRNSKTLDAKLSEIRQGQGIMLQAIADHLLTEKEILSPQQRRRFFELLKERMRMYGTPGRRWLPQPGDLGSGNDGIVLDAAEIEEPVEGRMSRPVPQAAQKELNR